MNERTLLDLTCQRGPRPAADSLCADARQETPVAGASRALTWLPDATEFRGPPTRVLATARVAAPLLLGGWMLALAVQGALLTPLAVVGLGLSLTVSAGADLWLRARVRTLSRNALALTAYTKRVHGADHELTRRACNATRVFALLDPALADPGIVIRAEESLRYTCELARRRSSTTALARVPTLTLDGGAG